ncbi:putative ABC transporter periplasmic binding protein [Octadecabacter arcticus 238]|jgi:inositol transport system substrate-binding protein|uniref:Putative ABC transporter periplasmic binding protein n=1 Tax=Octadecabacter arcticus 238 TaxID=391616 RepID=M9RL60_9RHOB|nr:substrate-binding domain-containing protein [Octadecabacter arcticus]AGI72483.1 putative ABC transporter periplasmic binding protein [Octadecabacter arcticus 238]
MFKRTFMLTATAVIAAVGLSAPVSAQSEEEVTLLVSPLSFAFPHFVFMVEQMEDEAALIGNVNIIVADGQLSSPKQITDIEAAIVQGVDGIIVAPTDADSLAGAVRMAIENGIPVVTVDRPVNGVPDVLANVAADNYIGAVAQGEQVIADFPEGATIVNLQGIPGDKTANDRNGGAHEALDAAGDSYIFVSEQAANFSRDEGLSVTENILTGLGDAPAVIIAANDDMALGAVQAVEARGLTGQVAIYGYDGSKDALRAVRDGTLAGTVDQFPGEQGRTAVRILVDHIRNGTVPESDNILLAPIAITSANLDMAERISLIGE